MYGNVAGGIMSKINREVFIKIVALVSLAFIYLFLMKIGAIDKYVHPRNRSFILFALFSMIIIAFFLSTEIFKRGFSKKKISSYIIFFIPLIILFITGETGSLRIKDNNTEIQFSDDDFLAVVEDIKADKDILGREVQLVGYIFRDENMKKNEFSIVRDMMICCSADTQKIGILCYGFKESMKNDTWVRAKGVFIKEDNKILLQVNELDIIDKLSNEYVYKK